MQRLYHSLNESVLVRHDGRTLRGVVVGRSHPINGGWRYDIRTDAGLLSNVAADRVALVQAVAA